jgi:hypothetical protein
MGTGKLVVARLAVQSLEYRIERRALRDAETVYRCAGFRVNVHLWHPLRSLLRQMVCGRRFGWRRGTYYGSWDSALVERLGVPLAAVSIPVARQEA